MYRFSRLARVEGRLRGLGRVTGLEFTSNGRTVVGGSTLLLPGRPLPQPSCTGIHRSSQPITDSSSAPHRRALGGCPCSQECMYVWDVWAVREGRYSVFVWSSHRLLSFAHPPCRILTSKPPLLPPGSRAHRHSPLRLDPAFVLHIVLPGIYTHRAALDVSVAQRPWSLRSC